MDSKKIGMYEVDDHMGIQVSNEAECAIHNALFHYAQADDIGKKVYSWDYMRGIMNTEMRDRDFIALMDIMCENLDSAIAYACTYSDTYDTEEDYLIVVVAHEYKFTVYTFDMHYYIDTTLKAYEAEEPETEADAWSRLCE